ncbi:hypothetical protein LWI28_000061 [Acer negundo]|uniref:Senescence regulator n=1 Tax=Acer negundo TaxID=4023 RepID=A0AAD5NYW8_ACENE|nr:hypothetical protein LWI28_000061 [Acer negundo]KAK4849701.1 hypothetical protein QYF36_000039 [Acer negundo]
MATSKSYYARPNYRFLSSSTHDSHRAQHDSPFELDESDLYSGSTHHSQSVTAARSDSPPEYGRKTTVSNSRIGKRSGKRSSDPAGGTAASLPVNIPDWSKILKEEYRENRRVDSDGDDEDFVGGSGGGCYGEGSLRVPPHEFLANQMARTRIASYSVHEGVGRTLKGGDLTRVRNAIWEKTGFQD